MRQESVLKSKLMEHIKLHMRHFIAIRHEDIRTSGIPDISLAGYGRNGWIEVKHGDPDFDSEGIQELTMLRLSLAGFYAYYLIYLEDEDGENKRTLIVHPKHLKDLEPEAWCVGHDHRWVVEWFRERHRP